MDRRIYGERHPQVANDLINLGAIQYEQAHFAEAEKYQRQALDITEGFYGKNHPETASAMTLLARTLVNEKRLDEAANLLQRSVGHPRTSLWKSASPGRFRPQRAGQDRAATKQVG